MFVHEGAAFFLICQKCGVVKELDMQAPLLKELTAMASKVGFTFVNKKYVKLPGECHQCHGALSFSLRVITTQKMRPFVFKLSDGRSLLADNRLIDAC